MGDAVTISNGLRGIEIERLVRRGAMSLADSLHFYWPSLGRNDIPERNISLHIGSALLHAGFLLYAEAHTIDSANVHLDLLGIHPSSETLVAAEFKRLYNGATARAMADDLVRLREWRLAQDRAHSQLRASHRFGLLAATTWYDKYAAWFLTEDARPSDPSGGELTRLWRELPGADVLWGAAPIGHAEVDRKRMQEWLVYVVFPL